MAKSQRKLADEIGVSQSLIRDAKKKLGITNSTLSKQDENKIKKIVAPSKKLKDEVQQKMTKKSGKFKPNVRRIDKQDGSSINDMLQDCKEQYVNNEELIQRLQYEISNQDILMNGNGNGTLSPLPQLSTLEKFQKINISLRNQIVQLEEELGRIAEPKKEDDPFE